MGSSCSSSCQGHSVHCKSCCPDPVPLRKQRGQDDDQSIATKLEQDKATKIIKSMTKNESWITNENIEHEEDSKFHDDVNIKLNKRQYTSIPIPPTHLSQPVHVEENKTDRKTNIPSLDKSIPSKDWETKQITDHIMKIDSLPEEYETLLKNGLKDINGYNISEVRKKHIKDWGIKKIRHIKQIHTQIQKLDVTIVPKSYVKAPEIDLSSLKSDKERDRLKKFHLKIYDTVELNLKGSKKGVIRFFGPVKYPSGRQQIEFGIELIDNDDKGGKHDGKFNDIEYFTLRKQNGIFVSSTNIVDKLE
eukprot:385155_1